MLYNGRQYLFLLSMKLILKILKNFCVTTETKNAVDCYPFKNL